MKRRARLAAVEAAVVSDAFKAALVEAIRGASRAVAAEDVRVFALAVLAAQGVDHDGVSLRVTWRPDQQRVEVWVKPAAAQPPPRQMRALP